jgi:hypothetical protein
VGPKIRRSLFRSIEAKHLPRASDNQAISSFLQSIFEYKPRKITTLGDLTGVSAEAVFDLFCKIDSQIKALVSTALHVSKFEMSEQESQKMIAARLNKFRPSSSTFSV